MTDVWINPSPRPHRPRPNSQLEQDLAMLRLDHLPRTPKNLADTVGKDARLPHQWGWEQVKAYQRVQALLMERAAKRRH